MSDPFEDELEAAFRGEDKPEPRLTEPLGEGEFEEKASWTGVVSTLVGAVKYLKREKALLVFYKKHRRTFRYDGIAHETVNSILSSPSIGSEVRRILFPMKGVEVEDRP